MSDQPKSNNMDETNMRYIFIERLKELIDEIGGDEKFIERLNRFQPKSSTEIKLLERWKDPKNDIQLNKIYLIAVACDVSADWLLGLSVERSRSGKGVKRPFTYGDVLTFFNNLFEMGILEIADSNHWSVDLDVYLKTDLISPKHIQIKDEHLSKLIPDLYKAQELSKKQITNAWEKILKSETDNPLPQYCSNPNHNDAGFRKTNSGETAVPVRVLDDDEEDLKKQVDNKAFKKKVSGRLRDLKGDLTNKEFGDKIGVSGSTVSDWVSSHLPKTYTLYRIAEEYGVSADWILGLDETNGTAVSAEDEVYTYGSVLSTLMYLIKKGTIGFVEEYTPSYDNFDDCEDNENSSVINDLLIVDDKFLFCLLLQRNIMERYSSDVFKKIFEEQINKYKDHLLLSFRKDMRGDSCEILCNLWNGRIDQDIDLDKLYNDLQKLNNSNL